MSSHTAVVGSPSGRDTWICRSGGSPSRNVELATGAPEPPGLASTTIEKPLPNDGAYTSMPPSVPDFISNISSARVRPRKVTVGPLAALVAVGEGAGVFVRVPVRVGEPG